jgi:ribosome biogenesis protein SLX9
MIACAIHHHYGTNELLGGGRVTGLEASRAPYSKSHARRLKRREKEQLTMGGLGSLKAALPSIAPTTKLTARAAAATIGDTRSAGKLDAAATAATTTTTTTTAGIDASVKPIDKLESKQPTIKPDRLEEAPPPPTTRPGQIGEGHGAPLTRSQRRRALYGPVHLGRLIFFKLCIRRKAERFRQPLIRLNPAFAANPFETIQAHARNTLVPHRPTT